MPKSLVPWLVLVAGACRIAGPSGEPPHIDDLRVLSAAEAFRIGSLEDPDAGFSRIGAVHLTSTGEVIVLDAAALEFRVFDADDGRFLRTIGRPGEGPGEFSDISGTGMLGDTLWVTDTRSRRITWFGPDGELLSTTPGQGIPLDVSGASVWAIPYYPLTDGLILSNRFAIIQGIAPLAYSYPVIRFDRDGRVVDTLRWEYSRPAETVKVSDREIPVPVYEPHRPISYRSGDAVVLVSWNVPPGANEGQIDVWRVTLDLDTVPIATFRYDPVPLPASVADSLMRQVLTLARYLGVSEGDLSREVRPAIELPDFRPPVRAVRQTADGAVWIEQDSGPADSTEYIVVQPDGTARGRVRLPPRMEVRNASGDVAWAVATDDLDVPWLVKLVVE